MLQIDFRYKLPLMKTVIITLLVFSGMRNTFAQHLDLEGYLQLLQEKSLVIQQSANQVAASHQDVLSARAALMPTVAAELSYQRDFTKNFLFLNEEDPSGFFPDKFRTNFNNNVNASVVAEQAIFNPTATSNYKLAKLAKELNRLRHEDLSKDLVNQGAQLFWQAVFTKESLQILEENKALAEAQWLQTRDLFEQGYASELQVRQSESFYKRSIPQLQSAQNTYKILLNEMRALASLPLDYPMELLGEINFSPEEWQRALTMDTNLIQNPQMRLLFHQVQMFGQQIETAKAARYPVININLAYNFNAQDNAFKFDNNNKLLFGQLNVQVPIFTGGYNASQIQKATIEKRSVLLEIQNTRLHLQKDLSNAQLNLETALEKIAEETEAIQLSEKELEIAGESQKLGLLTPVEIKEMRLGLTEAKLRLLNAHLDLRIARLQLDRILGKK